MWVCMLVSHLCGSAGEPPEHLLSGTELHTGHRRWLSHQLQNKQKAEVLQSTSFSESWGSARCHIFYLNHSKFGVCELEVCWIHFSKTCWQKQSVYNVFWRICMPDVDLVCTVQWKQSIIRGIFHSRHTFTKNQTNAVKHNPKKRVKTRSYTWHPHSMLGCCNGTQEELGDHRMPIYNLIYL